MPIHLPCNISGHQRGKPNPCEFAHLFAHLFILLLFLAGCRQQTARRMALQHQDLIEKAYVAFNAREVDTVLVLMAADVQWPKAWEGDYAYGHEGVREYWTRQWQEVNPIVKPVDFYETPDGRLGVTVHQLVKDKSGNVLFDGNVTHIYAFDKGKIKSMEIAKD